MPLRRPDVSSPSGEEFALQRFHHNASSVAFIRRFAVTQRDTTACDSSAVPGRGLRSSERTGHTALRRTGMANYLAFQFDAIANNEAFMKVMSYAQLLVGFRLQTKPSLTMASGSFLSLQLPPLRLIARYNTSPCVAHRPPAFDGFSRLHASSLLLCDLGRRLRAPVRSSPGISAPCDIPLSLIPIQRNEFIPDLHRGDWHLNHLQTGPCTPSRTICSIVRRLGVSSLNAFVVTGPMPREAKIVPRALSCNSSKVLLRWAWGYRDHSDASAPTQDWTASGG